VQSLWAGVENLVDALPEHIAIVRMEDPELVRSMAEAVLTWCLYLHRHMLLYSRQQKAKIWLQHPVVSASEVHVGILGLGKLGEVAGNSLIHHGFKVSGWSRRGKHLPGIEVYSGEQGFKKLLSTADILVVLLPLTDDTRSLLNSDTLPYLKKGAALINFARGALIETEALIKHLDDQRIAHAVLDVFEQEPLPKNDPLWEHPNITILPHISAPTNMTTASKIVAQNIRKFMKNGTLPHSVNKDLGY
jgi:glyoxylate/hydroxypyruvate reductase A